MKSWYRIENAAGADEVTIYLYSGIGDYGVGADQFIAAVKDITASTVHLHVNSGGGEVFDAFAMYNAIRSHDSHFIAHVDGLAASAATYPVLACDEVLMAKNAMMMIHNPLLDGYIFANASELRQQADILDKLGALIVSTYVERSTTDEAQILSWMSEEKWFTTTEAIAAGFVDDLDGDVETSPAEPQNTFKKYLNQAKHQPRVRPSERLQALGLDDLLPAAATPANTGRKGSMKPKNTTAAPAKMPTNAAAPTPTNAEGDPVWPDAADVREGVVYGPTGAEYTGTLVVPDTSNEAAESDATPANATLKQLKAEFGDDKDFILDRAEVDAPLVEHKAAYADRLKTQLASTREQLTRLKPDNTKRKPVDVAAPESDPDAPKPVTEERKNTLRSLARLPVKKSA